MAKAPVGDVILLLPGISRACCEISGSVLQKDGEHVWVLSGGAAVRALTSRGSSITDLKLDGDDAKADF